MSTGLVGRVGPGPRGLRLRFAIARSGGCCARSNGSRGRNCRWPGAIPEMAAMVFGEVIEGMVSSREMVGGVRLAVATIGFGSNGRGAAVVRLGPGLGAVGGRRSRDGFPALSGGKIEIRNWRGGGFTKID